MVTGGESDDGPAGGALRLTAALLPARFAPALERQYQAATSAASRRVRQVSLWLVLFIWLIYAAGDRFHHAHGSVELSDFLQVARIVGIVAVLIGIVALARRDAPAVGVLNGVCIVLYGCALATVLAVGLRNSFFYFTSLSLAMLLMVGPLRLPSRSVLTLLCLELGLTYLVLANGSRLLTLAGVGDAKGFASTLSPSVGSIAAEGIAIKASTDDPLSYFLIATGFYLLAFAAVGVVIAVERERLSRQTFVRERELSDNYARLESSQRSAAEKTAALSDAQGALKEEAERRNAEKTVFLRDLAHDLRNALAVVVLALGSARDAIRRRDATAGEAALDNASHATRLAGSTLNAVLDMARLESDQVSPDYANVELAPLLTAAAAMCEEPSRQRGVRVRLRPGLPGATVRSDPVLLARMIGNLVANAVKYSDPAKRERQRVLVGVVVFARRVRVDVVDNGIGIDPADLQRIWQPFVQLDNPQRDRERGVGLGLSIVRGIAGRLEQHRIAMKSTLGRGTRFSIDLPRGGDVVPGTLPPSGKALTDRLATVYLILVEDDAQLREAILTQLRRTGMLCDGFASYAALAAELDDIERRPDLILTDFRLPELCTGEDVIALLRARFDERIPAILLTGELGPFDFTELPGPPPRVRHKPIEPDALMREVYLALPEAE